MAKKYSFIYSNGLGIVFLLLAVIFLLGQVVTGLKEYNQFLHEHGLPAVDFGSYLVSGHFLQATFENWESEFFQMALFVILTISLRQKGSSESKVLSGKEEVDRKPKAHPHAPWPVKQGGITLEIYKYSLSIALVILFIVSFLIHWYGSWKDFILDQALKGESPETMGEYLGNHRFWFESFQNWQSEFLSVFALIVLSIYLRQQGSPQSKPVDAPHYKTGE